MKRWHTGKKQRCLPFSELDKHLHFSDSHNKSNKERNPLMSSLLLPFIQLIWCWSEIHFCKYSQAINWTMNILSSKAHIPAGVFSSLSNISEGKTFMKEITECLCSAGTALFPGDWRSNDSVCARSWLLSCLQRKRDTQIPPYLCWEHLGVS